MNENQEIEIFPAKKSRGRPQTYPGGYENHYKDTHYHLKYYHTHQEDITCDICKKKTTKTLLKQHQRSKKCCIMKQKLLDSIINDID
jgi:hypothetical protein